MAHQRLKALSAIILIILLTGLPGCKTTKTIQKLQAPYIQKEWTQDYPPFRIAGNLYYVGSYDLASYLITTPQGNILINTGITGSDTMIRRHIEALGFKFSDIKILLATHAHFDHVSTMAAIKKATGAQLMIEEKDAPLMADGGNSDYFFGGKGPIFQPVKVDRLLHNLDTVALGDMQIIVLHHPGHTKGACSFLFTVKDEARSYRVLIANMPTIIIGAAQFSSVSNYPGIEKDYAYTLDTMRKITFDCWLSSHSGQFGLHENRKPGDGYNPSVFMDHSAYDAELNDLKAAYVKKAGIK